jgi:hypothetical protein
MRNLSIFSVVISVIFLVIHILFNLRDYMPVLMVNILIFIFTVIFLLAVFYLSDQKTIKNRERYKR